MDESKAIRMCLIDKDPRGFEFLVEKYKREAYFHSYSWLRNSDDAQDACQESFAKAYLAMPRLEQLTQFYPWFYRILKNTCLNMLARKKTVTQYQETQSQEYASSLPSRDNPYETLTRDEEQQKVKDTLQYLKPEFREILVMKHFNGYSYDEMSKMLDIPKGTVMSRLYNARKAFKSRYMTENPPSSFSGKETEK